MYTVTHNGKDYPGAAELIFTGPMNRPPETVKLELDKKQLPGEAIGKITAALKETIGDELHPDPERGGRSQARHKLTVQRHEPAGWDVTRLALMTERTRETLTKDFMAKLEEKGIHVRRQPVIATIPFRDIERTGNRGSPTRR